MTCPKCIVWFGNAASSGMNASAASAANFDILKRFVPSSTKALQPECGGEMRSTMCCPLRLSRRLAKRNLKHCDGPPRHHCRQPPHDVEGRIVFSSSICLGCIIESICECCAWICGCCARQACRRQAACAQHLQTAFGLWWLHLVMCHNILPVFMPGTALFSRSCLSMPPGKPRHTGGWHLRRKPCVENSLYFSPVAFSHLRSVLSLLPAHTAFHCGH